MPTATPRIGFVSLGCPKATVDSERILTRLKAEGYDIAPDYGTADAVIVNTCGFIDSAIEESLDAIGEAVRENGRVIVTGCLGARDELVRNRFPDLVEVTGPHATEQVVDAVHRIAPRPHDPFRDLLPPGGIKLTPRHYAYLKVSEGCNNRCTFCIIPSMRGGLVSRPIGEVLDEAEALVGAGVRELLVVSQDTSAYGADRRYRTDFHRGKPLRSRMLDLAAALGCLGVWVRLHYVYPYPHVDKVVELMADGRILPYMDVPFQHASPRLLRLMRRPANSERILRRIERWRGVCPDIALRSTFIVGFPGETENDFEQLLAFLTDAQLDRVGCFTYSPVDGAAANALPGIVPDDVKVQRQQRLMDLQAEISASRLRRHVGHTMTILVDESHATGAVGRSYADSPEIDGRVVVRGKDLRVGTFAEVRVTGSDQHDLYAAI